LLGTTYFKMYGKCGEDEMIVHMAEISNLHALGLLVIDEIQHLKHAKTGTAAEDVLSFLVKMVNTIGVPVEFIGTPKANDLLRGNFRQGRRSSGIGALAWNPMVRDDTWEYFLKAMWQYQWTSTHTKLTPELIAVLHEVSQGVTDLVVKIFMLAQLRLIAIGETKEKKENYEETITPNLIRRVAREDFWLVKDMVDALARKDQKALSKYDDLKPLHQHLQLTLAAAVAPPSTQAAGTVSTHAPGTDAAATRPSALRILTALEAFGVAPDLARVMVEELGDRVETTNPMEVLKLIAHRVDVTPSTSGAAPARTRRKPGSKATAAAQMPESDLRSIVVAASKESIEPYSALLSAGAATTLAQDLVIH
jgi:hypothetical protein